VPKEDRRVTNATHGNSTDKTILNEMGQVVEDSTVVQDRMLGTMIEVEQIQTITTTKIEGEVTHHMET
jgi:hypothetical protein